MTLKGSVHLILLLFTRFSLIQTTSSDTTALALTDPSPTLSCSPDHEIACKTLGVDVCLSKRYKCDGIKHCDGATDELVSVCPDCASDPSKFVCSVRGNTVCLDVNYKCDGQYDCDYGSDESPSTCGNCQPGLVRCSDGSRCIRTERLCDKRLDCADGSDESDTWSNCTFCTEEGSVPCPGFPGNCAKVCDGETTCPDKWDELLSTCKAFDASCSKEDGLFKCNDGSSCLASKRVCNTVKDCADGEDERAEHCKDKCQSQDYPFISCDNWVDHPTQLTCISDKYLLCQQTNTKDMAGYSARVCPKSKF